MKKNAKKIFISALGAGLSFIAAFCLGCKSAEKLSLSDSWHDETVGAVYGSTYHTESYVSDVNGNSFAIDCSVTDSKGATVELFNGTFVVADYDGYVLKYFFNHDENDYSKTVTLVTEAAAPMIKILGKELFFSGGIYSLPQAVITDYIDGEINDYNVEIYKKTKDGAEKQENAIVDGNFKLTEAGEYYFLYSAKNSKQSEGFATLDFSVKSLEEYMPYAVDISNEDSSYIYYDGNPARSKFVSKKSNEMKAITGGYSGNAVKFTTDYGYEGQFRAKNIYPKESLAEIAEKYDSVSLWYAYDLTEPSGKEGLGELLFMTNNGTSATPLEYKCFFNYAGALGTAYIKDELIWEKLTISIDEYISLLQENNYEYAILFGLANRNDKVDPSKSGIYISDIVFENIVPAIAEIRKGNYRQFSFNGNSTSDYISYVPGKNLTDFDGDYSGNAVKYKIFAGHNGQYRATNPYTAEQLNAIKTQYNTVSMFIAFDLQLKEGQTADSMYVNMLPATSGTSFLSSAGITGTGFSKTYQKKWAKVSISVQDYIDGLSSDGKYFVLFRCGDIPAGVDKEKSGIYIGNVFFEKNQ